MARETIKQKTMRLEQEIATWKNRYNTMLLDYHRLEQEKQDLLDAKESDFSCSSLYQGMTRDIDIKNARIKNLENENKRLKDKIADQIQLIEKQAKALAERPEKVEAHNARHAGRKPDNLAIQKKRQQFADLLAEHRPMREIMQIMNISRSTFYNYYRRISEQNINFLDNPDN